MAKRYTKRDSKSAKRRDKGSGSQNLLKNS